MKVRYDLKDITLDNFDLVYAGLDYESISCGSHAMRAREETSPDVLLIRCDGYMILMQVDDQASDGYMSIIETTELTDLDDGVKWFDISGGYITVGGTSYRIMYDYYRNLSYVIYNSCVIVTIKANWNNAYGPSGNFLTGSTEVLIKIYVYPDRFFYEFTQTNSAILTLTYGNLLSWDSGLDTESGVKFLTNPSQYYENNGTESVASNYQDYIDSDYVSVVADELAVQSFVLNSYQDGTSVNRNGFGNPHDIHVGWGDGTLNEGTHKMSMAFVIDSAQRKCISDKTPWTDISYSIGDLVSYRNIGWECISTVTKGNADVTAPGTGTSWSTYWLQSHKYTIADRLKIGKDLKDLHIT